MIRDKDALDYHSEGRHGKVEVVPTKPCITQRDLSLAYTPGVAAPCLRIRDEPESAFAYTSRGNLVAVVSNGTAVLGLGNIGALAGKPVMEGKGVLFKRFADIDVFDLELNSTDPDEIIRTVEMLEPTFGGINLEDIKAPECFYIEEELKRRLSIPVFHDDQHGTAIISGAALLNALELVDKKIEDVRVVFNGAGASGIACAMYYLELGVRPENLIACDSRGVIHDGRDDVNEFKRRLAVQTDRRTLREALVGADVFVGCSVANTLDAEAVRSMAERPIILAMANPTPEIGYDEARAARDDAIVATGRSDYPNQVNNVLGFPFIFRGALDVRATAINLEMKLAATRALAELAREDVPDSVMSAYGLNRLHFGPDYLIPKPFDRRVLLRVSPAVAEAAMRTGVARRQVDIDEYRDSLERRLGKSREVMRLMINRAKRSPKRIVLTDGENSRVLRAAQAMLDEGFARPILLGDETTIRRKIDELDLHLRHVRILDPSTSGRRESYAIKYHRMRARKGVTRFDADQAVGDPTVFGALMVHDGDADALVGGIEQHYPDALRPMMQIIGTEETRAHSVHMMVIKDRVYFLADTTVNIDPDAEALAEIAISTADVARRFHAEARVAMLSFSNYGSVRDPRTEKVRAATEIVRRRRPDIMIDGEMQVDTALSPKLRDKVFPFSPLEGPANVLIFPDLQSANTGSKLLQALGGAEAVGPLLTGMRKPVHILQHGCSSKDVLYLAAIATVDAQEANSGNEIDPDTATHENHLATPTTTDAF
ncbi:MAG: NADP-dependent malic enzyme [bacterium]|nr:NADP-dependent malic enzyme [bacterium]